MTINPYQVLGTQSVILRGRQKLFHKLKGQITKPTPDHVQVIGAKFIGKTTFLKYVAEYFKCNNQSYTTAFYWDLGRETPSSDSEFLYRFARELRSVLVPIMSDIADELDPKDDDLGDILSTILEYLKDENHKVLVVFDGFDKLLGVANITRNLWDKLKVFAEIGSLCIVTGSCKTLRELCRTEASQTSDFWESFNANPLKVSAFEENDWSDILKPFTDRKIEFDSSAKNELINWSGGVPILTATMCKRLFAQVETQIVKKEQVDRVALEVQEQCTQILDALWDDCPLEAQNFLIKLTDNNLDISTITHHQREKLVFSGYAAKVSSNKLKSSCRLLQKYTKTKSNQINNLQNLFGNVDDYERNFRSLLELRLVQIQDKNSDLQRLIKNAIRDLNPEPTDALTWFRSIADTALGLIWQAELPNGTIPQHWLLKWEQDKEWTPENNNIPYKRGLQCNLLRVMTGTAKTIKVAQYISKSTFLLINHIQSLGDFGQHTEGQKISFKTAIACCLSAIELCDNLARELP